MSATHARYAVRGFLGTILLGIFLFGIPRSLFGAWDAWTEPVELHGKRSGEVKSIPREAAMGFYAGAFLGGIAGTIAGIGVAANRLLAGRRVILAQGAAESRRVESSG